MFVYVVLTPFLGLIENNADQVVDILALRVWAAFDMVSTVISFFSICFVSACVGLWVWDLPVVFVALYCARNKHV